MTRAPDGPPPTRPAANAKPADKNDFAGTRFVTMGGSREDVPPTVRSQERATNPSSRSRVLEPLHSRMANERLSQTIRGAGGTDLIEVFGASAHQANVEHDAAVVSPSIGNVYFVHVVGQSEQLAAG